MANAQSNFGPTIAAFARQMRTHDLPPDVVHKAKLHTLDTLAAIVSGAALEAGIAGQKYAQSVGGSLQASVLGTSLRAPLIETTLANGMAAHADESDDSHEDSLTHPGCGVLPAALSVGELLGRSGRDFLNAVVLGYETTTRFAEAFGTNMTMGASSLASHAYGPLIGAGYAAGALMRFDETQFRILLNYLGQEASGLTTWRLDERHTLKSYVFAGMPASNGVKCAALVQSGFTGDGDALNMADRNMLDSICPSPRPERLTQGLGQRFKILDCDIKKYPVGFPIAAPVAALERLLADHGPFDIGRIETIRVYYHDHWYRIIGDSTRMPDVNLRYCLATTLVDGALTFEAAHDVARMSSADVVAAGRLIEFCPPKPHLQHFDTSVEIVIDGRTLIADQDRNVLGRAENPMSEAQVRDKAQELMATVIGTAAARKAIDTTMNLDSVKDVRALIAQLTR